jgi:hypothetical protein
LGETIFVISSLCGWFFVCLFRRHHQTMPITVVCDIFG